ncbi:hypothetical protein KBC55_01425 [Patescibacteria group bacterium]|nr:hypothetical protein [Patescibacteria group bacterium]
MFLLFASIASLILLVLAARFVIAEVDVLSRALHSSRFGLSFLLLGFLTSLTEIAVAINAQADGHPEIYAGNLIGGAFVILLLIIPFLAILKRGLPLQKHLPPSTLFLFCGLMGLPVLVALDGMIGVADSIALILAYAAFVFATLMKSGASFNISVVFTKKVGISFIKICLASVAIFASCHYLVLGTEELAAILGFPAFVVSIILLALGTNIPELSLAIASIVKKKADVALGDYVGSASLNALILGGFSLMNGPYSLGITKYQTVLYIFLLSLLIFLVAAYTKKRISLYEAMALIACYGAILAFQAFMHF